jgi:2-oxoglutarate dehydrogenase complex dehydrogenase (E1) component-like enzyme
LIETSANQFKSPGNSPTKFTTGFLEPNFYSNIKKRASYVEIPRLKMYSIEELSIVIVKLEKLQADLKEKLSGAPNNNQEILKSEIKANENKLAEAKNLQKKLIMAGKIKNFEVL